MKKRPRSSISSIFATAVASTALLSSSDSPIPGAGAVLGLSERILSHTKFRRVQDFRHVAANEYIVQEVENKNGGFSYWKTPGGEQQQQQQTTTEALCASAQRDNCTCTLPLSKVMLGFVLNCTDEEVLHKLLEEQGVQMVHQAQIMYADEYTNKVQIDPPSWGLDRIDQLDLPLNHQYSYGSANGTGIDVYIGDTGILATHQEFGSGRVECFYDYFHSPGGSGMDGGPCEDGHGHGTHVAGIVGGEKTGVAKNVNLKAVKVLTSRGSGSDVGIVAAMESIIQRKSKTNPTIVNFSLGGAESQVFNTAVAKAAQNNILVVVAAGNTNSDACDRSPSGEKTAFAVAATNKTDGHASFSNWGPCVDVYAPGQDITSASSKNNTSYETWSGTSMAAPHIAGLASLYWQVNKSMTQFQVQQAILNDSSSGKVTGNTWGTVNKLANTVHVGEVSPAMPTTPRAPTPVAPTLPGGSSGNGNGICTDINVDWKDDCCNDGCSWYELHEPVGCPNYYHELGTGGISAGEACCHCGGGTVPSGVCIDKAGWADSYNDGCEWFEANDDEGCPNYRNTQGTSGRTAGEACCHCGGGTRGAPSAEPTVLPSMRPTRQPTRRPSARLSAPPSAQPTERPTRQPSARPTPHPSAPPTPQPSAQPTPQPSARPTPKPSAQPTPKPSALPTRRPTAKPSLKPTAQPAKQPSATPTLQPTHHPTLLSSHVPSSSAPTLNLCEECRTVMRKALRPEPTTAKKCLNQCRKAARNLKNNSGLGGAAFHRLRSKCRRMCRIATRPVKPATSPFLCCKRTGFCS